jgi:hypothetical protein
MRNWLFPETRNFAKQPVSLAKQRNSFRIEFRETKSETSFAGNPSGTAIEFDESSGKIVKFSFKEM